MTQPFRVLIADDHAHAREGIRAILSSDPTFQIVAEAKDGREAVQLTEQWIPELILMDISMPHMNGLEATKIIKDKHPNIKIVMVTVSDDSLHLFEALKKGAQGYLIKNLNPTAWHEYLKAVAVDEAPVSRELANRILQEFSQKEIAKFNENLLTGREREILGWVAKGLSNREIAEKLEISEHTVKNHLKNILHKLHLENRVQLAGYAFKTGLVQE
ncbi:response regulator [Ferviditalea candida]|uniref:Response regulator transcription factor n=1 Tax=Ferviditalea candida TaxID=3108399 RepID=A0ABU5ZJN8_9BACL|nr:response regulator transcription factor [Paenibacillaceae bacterium T2]